MHDPETALREEGSAAVEFALVATLLVTLLFGIMEFGYVFFVQGTMYGSAREAAREYAIHHAESTALDDAVAAAVEAGAGFVEPSMVDIPSTACTAVASSSAVTVTITRHDFKLTGFFGEFDLTAKGTMRCNG